MDDWKQRFVQQVRYQAEGAEAALLGKTRADCPYDEAAQSEAWNMWVYGCEEAQGEMATLAAGEVFYTDSGPPTEDFMKPGTGTPLRVAYEEGLWKPKYVRVPADWSRRAWYT